MTIRNTDLEDEIIERLSKGEPLLQICADEGMPTRRAIQLWAKDDEEFGKRYAEARSDGFDAIAESCLEIADDGTNDYTTDKDGNEVLDRDHIQRSKLRVWTRLQLLEKWDSRRYGAKVQQEHSGSIAVSDALEAARQRVIEHGRKARESAEQ